MCFPEMNVSDQEINMPPPPEQPEQQQQQGEPVLLQLLPMFGCLSVTFVEDNAKSPAQSVSEEKIKTLPLKRHKTKDRWENAATKSVFPTRDETIVDEVKQPLRRPSVDKEALSRVISECIEGKWNMSKPPEGKCCPDASLRSSVEARKPCRRPSVDEEAIRQLAEELFDDEDVDCLRSSWESKQASPMPNLDLIIEEMGESQCSFDSASEGS